MTESNSILSFWQSDPFANIQLYPDSFKAYLDVVYAPTYKVAEVLDRPLDQMSYLLSFILAMLVGQLMNNMTSVPMRKLVSPFFGILI